MKMNLFPSDEISNCVSSLANLSGRNKMEMLKHILSSPEISMVILNNDFFSPSQEGGNRVFKNLTGTSLVLHSYALGLFSSKNCFSKRIDFSSISVSLDQGILAISTKKEKLRFPLQPETLHEILQNKLVLEYLEKSGKTHWSKLNQCMKDAKQFSVLSLSEKAKLLQGIFSNLLIKEVCVNNETLMFLKCNDSNAKYIRSHLRPFLFSEFGYSYKIRYDSKLMTLQIESADQQNIMIISLNSLKEISLKQICGDMPSFNGFPLYILYVYF